MLLLDQTHAPDICTGQYFLDGQVWSQVDPSLCRDNPTFPFDPGDRVTPYRIFHLVGLRIDGTAVEIVWDVDHSAAASLTAIVDFLQERTASITEVRLCFNKAGWFAESYGLATNAARRIEDVAAYRGLPVLRSTFIENRTDRACSELSPSFQRLLAKWQPGCPLGSFRQDHAFGRSILMAEGQNGNLVFEHIGAEAAITHYFGQDWRAGALGAPVDLSLPDLQYDRDTGGQFQSVIGRGEPRVDCILSSIQRTPVNREWCAYHRLLLPAEDHLLCLVQLCSSQSAGIQYLAPQR